MVLNAFRFQNMKMFSKYDLKHIFTYLQFDFNRPFLYIIYKLQLFAALKFLYRTNLMVLLIEAYVAY